MRRNILLVSPLLLALTNPTNPARAITAEDVMEKMGEKESGAYIAASVEMAAFLAHIEGYKARSACIVQWYFDTSGTPAKVVKVFARFPDRTPQAILHVLMKRQCGAPETAPETTEE